MGLYHVVVAWILSDDESRQKTIIYATETTVHNDRHWFLFLFSCVRAQKVTSVNNHMSTLVIKMRMQVKIYLSLMRNVCSNNDIRRAGELFH